MTTPNFEITEMQEGQSGGEVLYNDGINKVEALAQCTIMDRGATAPPGGENNGEVWIVAAAATGAWSGQDDDLAIYYDGWIFITPLEGWRVWIKDEDVFLTYDGSSWVVIPQQVAAEADLSQTITNPPTQAEVQAITDKVDALLAKLRTSGVLAT